MAHHLVFPEQQYVGFWHRHIEWDGLIHSRRSAGNGASGGGSGDGGEGFIIGGEGRPGESNGGAIGGGSGAGAGSGGAGIETGAKQWLWHIFSGACGTLHGSCTGISTVSSVV